MEIFVTIVSVIIAFWLNRRNYQVYKVMFFPVATILKVGIINIFLFLSLFGQVPVLNTYNLRKSFHITQNPPNPLWPYTVRPFKESSNAENSSSLSSTSQESRFSPCMQWLFQKDKIITMNKVCPLLSSWSLFVKILLLNN